MTKPVRLQLSRKRGFSLQALSLATNGLPAVNCARLGKWGNPFDFRSAKFSFLALSFGCRGDRLGRREASVRAFREWISPGEGKRVKSMERQVVAVGPRGKRAAIGGKASAGVAPSHEDIVETLGGKNLACWCVGSPCHCDVLLELANIDAIPAPQPQESI